LLPLQQRRRDLAEAAWRAGASDVGTILRAEQELRASEASRLLLQQDQWLARIELERAVGGPAALAAAEQQDSERKGRP
jgi:outer membrane protein TolC